LASRGVRCACRVCSSWAGVRRSLFFRAEDGIRDRNVTGVQTCALPIFIGILILGVWTTVLQRKIKRIKQDDNLKEAIRKYEMRRSEERRVGKECSARCWP